MLFLANLIHAEKNSQIQNHKDEVAHGGGGGGHGGGGHGGGGHGGGGHGGGGHGGGSWGGHGGGNWGHGHGGGDYWGPVYGPVYYPPNEGYLPPVVNRYTYTTDVLEPEQPSEPGEVEPGIDQPGDDGQQPPPDDGEEPPEDGIDIDTLIDIITGILNGQGIDLNGLNINIDNGTIDFGGDSGWGSFYGDSSATSVPLNQSIVNQHVVTKDNPRNIKGCYDTNFGIMRLHIKGNDEVTGTYHYNGKVQYLKGKLKDNVLVGVWMEDINGKQANKVGTFQFVFKPKWASFKGFWGQDKNVNQAWDGTKIKCPPPPAKQKIDNAKKVQ